jgi:hypothetical protein
LIDEEARRQSLKLETELALNPEPAVAATQLPDPSQTVAPNAGVVSATAG